ncbi:hypothetical protein ACFYZ4_11475 [Streptomyces sp. NPDC001513]|uniref:hypothetical protein n=1 Tax=Streptomyces sp. NPDC001513 TaxID=3364580 RepID=UPI0036AE2995
MSNPTEDMNAKIAKIVKEAKPEEIISMLNGSDMDSIIGARNQNHNNNPLNAEKES